MARKNRKQKAGPPAAVPKFEVDPFADLNVPKEMLAEPAPPPAVPPPPPLLGNAVPPLTLRLERKGRGGKTVTLISSFAALDIAEQMQLLQLLKKQLGSGGVFADDQLELQGDQRQALPKLLLKLGFRLKP